jgi:hypothetical protein
VGRAPWWIPCGAAVLTVSAAAWLALPPSGGPDDCAPQPVAAAHANEKRSTLGLAADPLAAGASQTDPSAPAAASYTVALKSDATGRSWTGTERVEFGNAGSVPITEFWIRVWGNGVAGCEGDRPAERISVLTGGRIAENGQDCTAYRIVLDHPLAAGARGQVDFDLAIDVPERRDRFGSVDGQTYLGNALPLLAVKDEHGWELPPYSSFGESFYSLTADFDVILDHPTNLLTPSTGVVADERAAGDRTVTHVKAPKVRDFAWSVGAFHHDKVTSATGVEVDAYWPDSESDSNVRHLLRCAADAVDAYSNRLGAYPYPQLTLVFAEFGAAFDGMEYPNYLLTSAYQGAVAHEVAHQWWYGLVGDDQYRHPWLDEAFAEYTAEQFQGGTSPAHSCDFLAADERMDQTMETYTRSGDYMYHDAIYHEGTCLLFDLEHTIGRDAMNHFLRTLVQKYEYGVVRPDDVRAAAQASTSVDLSGFWARWRNTGE